MRDDGHEDRNEEAMGRAAASAGARYGSLELCFSKLASAL